MLRGWLVLQTISCDIREVFYLFDSNAKIDSNNN